MGAGDRIVYRVSSKEPIVALTIDDGPFAPSTAAILDELQSNGARATFFIIGTHVRNNEAIMERLVREGHEIGHHMLNDFPSHKMPVERFRQEFLETDAILRRFTSRVHWFRPGSGRFTAPMLEVVRDYGYQGVLGDVYPLDVHIPSIGFAYEMIVRAISPGSILILHDGRGRGERTAVVLKHVMPVIKVAGYRVVTLTDLTAAASTGAAGIQKPELAFHQE
jgi:peptidoglycan/xylan/chitin deacetylase (PgdA/CDA1 family)